MKNENRENRIERLISRHLDGEITAEEQLELDRAILRDPEVRSLFEEAQRIDSLAMDSLQGVMVSLNTPFEIDSLTSKSRQVGRSYGLAWWLMPGAIAAVIVVGIFVVKPVFSPIWEHGGHDAVRLDTTPVVESATGTHLGLVPEGPVELVNDSPRRIKRHTDREVIGIVGEDGNIYWLEVDHVKTLKTPEPLDRAHLTSGDM